MKLRCKPGDIAVVIAESPGCESNIGRMVRVAGPLNRRCKYGPAWLIRPLRPEPWAIEESDGTISLGVVRPHDQIEHADRWLLPVKGAEGRRLTGARRGRVTPAPVSTPGARYGAPATGTAQQAGT